jgi:uncharacterized membrane protein
VAALPASTQPVHSRRAEYAELPSISELKMAPLIVMVVIWVALRVVGLTGWWARAKSSRWALRLALASMFLFTAVSHFHPRTRPDLVQMVPPGLPEPALLVTATGVLELSGAAGLLVPPVARAAAFGLIGLLAAMFPANLYAAQQGLVVAGRPASPLVWRLPLQLFWMWALWWATRAQQTTKRPGRFADVGGQPAGRSAIKPTTIR